MRHDCFRPKRFTDIDNADSWIKFLCLREKRFMSLQAITNLCYRSDTIGRLMLEIKQRPFTRLDTRSTRIKRPEDTAFSLCPHDDPEPLRDLLLCRTHGTATAIGIITTLQFRHEPGQVSCTGQQQLAICRHGQAVFFTRKKGKMPTCMCRSAQAIQETAPFREIILGDIRKNSMVVYM